LGNNLTAAIVAVAKNRANNADCQKSVPSVIARNEVTKQSMGQSMFLDCFASLAMTEYGLYRQPGLTGYAGGDFIIFRQKLN
jgi:hypothetical protein